MKRNLTWSIGLTALLICGGIVGVAFTTYGINETMGLVKRGYGGTLDVYATMVVLATIALIIYFTMRIWGIGSQRLRNRSLAAVTIILLLTTMGFEIHKVYQKSFARVSESEVDLNQYKPFGEDTKVVGLSEASTLQLTGELPRLDGATALYPVYSAFVQATYPKGDYSPGLNQNGKNTVVCTTTGTAYERLINGESDIIFVTQPSEEQRKYAESQGVTLQATPIGREAFVFFVNTKNPIEELSTTDIQKIYSGKATNWRSFGGEDAEILAYQRPEGSGSQIMLKKFLAGVDLIEPPLENVSNGMSEIITNVADYKNYKNAIGYTFRFYANEMVKDEQIKLISLNGVEPTRENIANETYPYADKFYAVTAGTENPNVEKLIDWILSEQGQYLIEKTGYVPL